MINIYIYIYTEFVQELCLARKIKSIKSWRTTLTKYELLQSCVSERNLGLSPKEDLSTTKRMEGETETGGEDYDLHCQTRSWSERETQIAGRRWRAGKNEGETSNPVTLCLMTVTYWDTSQLHPTPKEKLVLIQLFYSTVVSSLNLIITLQRTL